MNEFKRILVAVDGSETSERAVDNAIRLAGLSKGSLDLLYVANLTGVTGGAKISGAISLPESVLESIRHSGNAALDHVMEKVPKEIKAVCHCETGLPAETILAFAQTHKSDLIVVGSRGLNAVNTMLLGSVSQHLAEHAKCPVLIVK